ncbi:MAG: acyl-ACP--UDP-N-acetylglucosamine O-acyltransferase [Firmicutes bacterium]|nr:acyl-ACP--UDP-N-acetylglucosamine O-acyltransferase [Bacillota bacterium]
MELRQNAKVVPFSANIHPTAIIDPAAVIGANVEIGPYSIIGAEVEIGDNTTIGPHVVIQGPTKIGKNNRIYAGANLGSDPQDLKYKGEKSYLFIGDNNIIREYASITRGTAGGGGETRIGNNNLIMTYAHIDHDCQVGNNCILVNGSALAGHVVLEDRVIIGGLSGVHQFSRIGMMTMVGACTKVTKDVPPFLLVDGHPAKVVGINIVGLRRNGITPEVRSEIKRAYKVLYRTNLNVSQAVEQMEQELHGYPEIDHFIRFIRNAERGILR